jgi:hypothetical protein
MQMQMQKQKQKQVTMLPLCCPSCCGAPTAETTFAVNDRGIRRTDRKGSPSTASWSGLIVQVPHIDAKSRIEGRVGSQPLSKASRIVPEAKAKCRHQGSGHPSAGKPASRREVNSAADLEYPPSCSKSAQKQPDQRLLDCYWRAAGSPAGVLVIMLPTMMNANAAAPMGVMT